MFYRMTSYDKEREEAFERAAEKNAELLAKIFAANKHINEDSVFEKSRYEIAKMIPDNRLRWEFCKAAIADLEIIVRYSYARVYLNDFNNKHREIIAISIIFSGFVAIGGELWLTIISGGLLYAYLSRKAIRKSIDEMSWRQDLDDIAKLKLEIDELYTLRDTGNEE